MSTPKTVYEGALVAESDGNVGVNNDNPQHTLDVTGNLNVMKEYKIQGNSVVSATTLGPSVLYSNLQRVGNLEQLVIAGNCRPRVCAGCGGDINFTGNLLYAGNLFVASGQGQGVSDPEYMTYGRTTEFTYTGVGVSYTNPLPFYTLLQSRGAALVSSGGENANLFTFLGSGTFAVQVEVETGYPWFPEGDITTYFLVNGDTKMGVEHHTGGASFRCTRSFLLEISVGDTLAFVVDSIVGNEYEATIETCNIRFTKIEVGGGGGAASFNGTFEEQVQFTGLAPGVTDNLLFLNSETGNVTYGPLSSVANLAVAGNVSAENLSASNISGTLSTNHQPNITSVGTLSTLNISGNVAAGNLSTNAISATAISTTGNVSAGNVTVSGKLNVNGAEWASTVIYGTTTPFIYTGPGSTYGNGVPFYAQTATQGTPFVTASGTSNSIFTFVTAGTYMLQSEIDVQFPWMPDGDTNTFYLVNGNSSVKFGSELHVSNRFRCSRPFLLTASASDNVRFIIDSSSGNNYEVGLSRTRITILKLA